MNHANQLLYKLPYIISTPIKLFTSTQGYKVKINKILEIALPVLLIDNISSINTIIYI